MKGPIFILSIFMADLFIIAAAFAAQKPSPPEPIARPNATYKAEGLKDPFKSYLPLIEVSKPAAKGGGATLAAEATPPSLNVQGLIWGGSLPQAIVNNKIVKIGDTIDGAQVIGIDKNGITVLFEQREYKLSPTTLKAKPSKNP